MTTQGMFDLVKEQLRLFDYINQLPRPIEDVPAAKKAVAQEKEIVDKLNEYVPYFTPMDCKHCYNAPDCRVPIGTGVCHRYEVKLNEKQDDEG